MKIELPTSEEAEQFGITSFKGIDVGLGKEDKVAEIAAKLEEQYPMHLILVQAGGWLNGYDRTAHVLHRIKKYQLLLGGSPDCPHIKVGFPLGGYKRRLWSMVNEYNTPCVISLGTLAAGRNVFVMESANPKGSLLAAVPEGIVMKIIDELRQHKLLNEAGGKDLVSSAETSEFKLKSHAEQLDLQLTKDLMVMPRDIRATWGENVRVCMAYIMRSIYAYGLDKNKPALLDRLSADVDLLKHYLSQAPRLNKLKFAFEHRASLAVELGRLLGGVMRAAKDPT